MGKMQRRKGSTFELKVAGLLRSIYPQARRGIGQARSAGEVADVELTPWWVECKHHKRVSVMAAWRQAAAATDGRPVLIVHRQNRGPVLVTLELSNFMHLVAGRAIPLDRKA